MTICFNAVFINDMYIRRIMACNNKGSAKKKNYKMENTPNDFFFLSEEVNHQCCSDEASRKIKPEHTCIFLFVYAKVFLLLGIKKLVICTNLIVKNTNIP